MYVGETETEPELPEAPEVECEIPEVRKGRSDSSYSMISASPEEIFDLPRGEPRPQRKRTKTLTMHDLTHRFFRKPVIVLSRLDIFRLAAHVLICVGLIADMP